MVELWSAFATNHTPSDASTWPVYVSAMLHLLQLNFRLIFIRRYQQSSDQNIVLDATLVDAKLSVQSGLKQVGPS